MRASPTSLRIEPPMKRLLPLLVVLPLAACSWGIKMESGGKAMRVAWNDDVSACRDLGKVTVSVLNRVGPIDRSKIKVNDELEIMARNEASTMQGADTIKPLGEVRDGQQSWGVYSCGGALSRNAPPRQAPQGKDGVETFPIREN